MKMLASRVKSLHAPKAGGWGAEHRGSAASRGYGSEWTKLRTRIMYRDCGLCQVCKAKGLVTPAHAVDHIVPKAAGGSDSEGNLQAICNLCHAAKTRLEAAAGMRGG